LIGHYSGSFNIEGVNAARQKVLALLAKTSFERWYRVCVYGADVFAAPDVIAQANANEIADNKNGCCCIIHVCSNDLQKRIREGYSHSSNNKPLFVDTIEQALIEIVALKRLEMAAN